MPSILAVRKSALPSLPENVRRYVTRHFREQSVLGITCLVASRHSYHPSGGSRWSPGTAPSHSVDLMEFGKSEAGMGVGDEIRLALKGRPEDLFEASVEETSRPSIDCD